MAKHTVDEAGVAEARALTDARHYVVRSRWAYLQPSAKDGTEIELAAHDLLQRLDAARADRRRSR